jgi:hypothetical protein
VIIRGRIRAAVIGFLRDDFQAIHRPVSEAITWSKGGNFIPPQVYSTAAEIDEELLSREQRYALFRDSRMPGATPSVRRKVLPRAIPMRLP